MNMVLKTYDKGDKVLYRREDGLADVGIIERVLVFANNDLIVVFYQVHGYNIEQKQILKLI